MTKISQITKAWNAKKLAEQASDSHKDVRAKLADKEFETKNVTEHARLKTIVVAADGFKTAGDTAFKDTTPANKDTHYSTATAAYEMPRGNMTSLGRQRPRRPRGLGGAENLKFKFQ